MILLDTHVVLWLAAEQEKLSAAAVEAVAEARSSSSGVAVSDITLWELAMLSMRGHVQLPRSLQDFLQDVERNYVVLPILWNVAELSHRFSDAYPRDPADRIIGATAVAHGLRLVTRDGAIRGSGEVPCVW